ncbi:MAG: polysaccharide deacetylase family protein [Candidatus Marinimicrobia bacterium]|nr:polysaccharide deacetylase family protein [Candidatus Neomarinimicrobiota bacterium]
MTTIRKQNYRKLLQGVYEPPSKEFGVPDFAFNPLNQSGDIYRPVIDQAWVQEHGKPIWPKGKEFAVCLTHDVDAVSEFNLSQNVRSILKLLKNDSKRPLGEVLRWILIHKLNALRGIIGRPDRLCDFENWLDLEEGVGARSTFFFAPETVTLPHNSDCMYKYDQTIHFRGELISVAELMRMMDSKGWEIGLHPSWHTHNNLEEMISQKRQVENIVGHDIQSVRQHFLKYNPMKTPQTQSLAGFKVDSTLGFNDNVGFRRGTSYPFSSYNLETNEKIDLLHIPLTVQDGALMLSEKGLRLDADTSVEYVKLMLDAVQEVGGVLNLSWHPHTINRPGFWDVYKRVLELVQQEDPWFATIGELGKWWSKEVKIDLDTYTAQLASDNV